MLGSRRWTTLAELVRQQAAAVAVRLFPWTRPEAEPVAALRWATGRGELPSLEPVTSWRRHCSPLEEWDGA